MTSSSLPDESVAFGVGAGLKPKHAIRRVHFYGSMIQTDPRRPRTPAMSDNSTVRGTPGVVVTQYALCQTVELLDAGNSTHSATAYRYISASFASRAHS